jgi:hypothetical protein
LSHHLGLLLAGAALFLLVAPPASAGEKLSIPVARERAATFAESTCAHDDSCAGSGVQNCRRLSDRVVLCRIFDHRKTAEQGNFACTRLVRLALKPPSRRVDVTGVGDWDC